MTMIPKSRQDRPRAARRGFTLAEVLVCAVLLALGFIALIAAFGQDSVAVQRSEEITLASSLANEIRDATFQMTFAEIRALDKADYCPAHLSTGPSGDLANWRQTIKVTPVYAKDLDVEDKGASPKAVKLTVTVSTHDKTVLVQSYYFFDPSQVLFTDGKSRS